ncbi:hypothetical protein [Streptomyces scabiei]|nr:hypothetical protein [Streptomyces scabiei]
MRAARGRRVGAITGSLAVPRIPEDVLCVEGRPTATGSVGASPGYSMSR